MKKKLQKFGIILGIMSILGNNKKHNDKFLKEFQNRIMMKILSIIPTSLVTCFWLISLQGDLFLAELSTGDLFAAELSTWWFLCS